MIPFAIVAFTVGVADLIAGFSGGPRGFVRCAFAWMVGVGASAGVAWGLGYEVDSCLALAGGLALFLPSWFLVRSSDPLSLARGAFGFWLVLLVFGGLVATGVQWPAPRDDRLVDWVNRVPLAGFDGEWNAWCLAPL